MQTSRKSILVVFGTRPEIIKIAPVIKELDAMGLRSSMLVVNTNQHAELLQHHIDFWEIKIDISFSVNRSEKSLTSLLTQSLNQLQQVLNDYQSIEYVVVQGDTNTALACSHAAFFNRKKLLHIEAGLRTHQLFNPFPEEFNRVVTSIVAHHHFAPTNQNKENLLKSGINPDTISVVGNTIVDAIEYTNKRIGSLNTERKDKVIITIHRRETNHSCYLELARIIRRIKQFLPHLTFVWVCHPSNATVIQKLSKDFTEIEVSDYLTHTDFFKLYHSSCLIITDSGGVTEEGVQLGIPVIVYRNYTERVEPIDTGYPFLVSKNQNEIVEFAQINTSKSFKPGNFYDGGNASKKIAQWIKNNIPVLDFNTIVIGGGPAGTGIFMKSIKDGTLDQLLSKGICVVDKSHTLVSGNLSEYQINSDTYSNVFLECLEGEAANSFCMEKLQEGIRHLEKYADTSIPLPATALFLQKLGIQLKDLISQYKQSQVLLNTEVVAIRQNEANAYDVYTSDNKVLSAKNIVIACGGRANSIGIAKDTPGRVFHSDEVIKGKADKDLELLKPGTKIVVVGGSHSAFSVAHYLLDAYSALFSEENPIEIWSKEIPKIYFPTPESAYQHGYSSFSDDDICPKTNRVFRLAGLRMDGRQLCLNMLGLGTEKKERRVVLRIISNCEKDFNQSLQQANLVIEATGYAFNMPKFYNPKNEILSFQGVDTLHWVDDQCRLILEDGTPLDNVYAIGLATGFIPKGNLGGERSFEGQTNGLWYYQNLIAEIILKQLCHENTAALP